MMGLSNKQIGGVAVVALAVSIVVAMVMKPAAPKPKAGG
jgi:hypothetical protein